MPSPETVGDGIGERERESGPFIATVASGAVTIPTAKSLFETRRSPCSLSVINHVGEMT